MKSYVFYEQDGEKEQATDPKSEGKILKSLLYKKFKRKLQNSKEIC